MSTEKKDNQRFCFKKIRDKNHLVFWKQITQTGDIITECIENLMLILGYTDNLFYYKIQELKCRKRRSPRFGTCPTSPYYIYLSQRNQTRSCLLLLSI